MGAIGNRLKFIQALDIIIILLLAGICWMCHFWDSSNFGLYEDDYFFVGQPISKNFNGLVELVKNVWMQFLQGRPLGFSCSYILAFIGFNLAGFNGVYCCGYLVITTNTLLFYWLLDRVSRDKRLAAIGGLAFCLFPADTTATFLTHSLGLYCCVTFFLIAAHAYISSLYWLAYLFIAASLISYETCLLLFLSVPLLKEKWSSKLRKEMILNGAIVLALLIVSVIIRKLIGESRISELTPLTAIGISVKHTLLGPFVSLGMYLYRPIYTIFNWRSELFGLVPLAFAIIYLLLQKVFATQSKIRDRHLDRQVVPRSQLWIAGAILLVSAYPLTIILSSGVIDGRGSRVHLAAIVGGSMLCALGIDRLLSIVQTNTQKRLGSIGVATLFALLVGFGTIVQSDYHLAWQKQQYLFASIVRLCPDLEEGTTIFVEHQDLHNPTQIAAYSWSMPLLLEQIYQFPDRWQIIPRVYPVYPDWQQQIDNPERLPLNKITEWLTFIPKQHPGIIKSQTVIMLKNIDGKFTRLDRLSLKNGIVINFKPRTPQPKLEFPTLPLYPYLIGRSSQIPSKQSIL
jgi:hypothetical protein